MTSRRWLFADQLGPQFLNEPDQPALLVESRAVFRRRRFHRAKAHLLLSGLRHRALELGEQTVFLQVDTYDEALRALADRGHDEPLSVVQPTSYAADRFVRQRGFEVVSEGAGLRDDPGRLRGLVRRALAPADGGLLPLAAAALRAAHGR